MDTKLVIEMVVLVIAMFLIVIPIVFQFAEIKLTVGTMLACGLIFVANLFFWQSLFYGILSAILFIGMGFYIYKLYKSRRKINVLPLIDPNLDE